MLKEFLYHLSTNYLLKVIIMSTTMSQSQTYTSKNSYTIYSPVDSILSMVETRSKVAIVDSILSHVQPLPMVDYILTKVNQG